MQKMRKLMTDNSGFTLIELLVVIAVLGILAAVAIPRLGGVTDKARLTEGQSFAGTLRQAQEMYYAENNAYVVTGSGLVGTGLDEYIDSDVPDGWTIEYGSYGDGYQMKINNSDYSLGVLATRGGVSTKTGGTYQ